MPFEADARFKMDFASVARFTSFPSREMINTNTGADLYYMGACQNNNNMPVPFSQYNPFRMVSQAGHQQLFSKQFSESRGSCPMFNSGPCRQARPRNAFNPSLVSTTATWKPAGLSQFTNSNYSMFNNQTGAMNETSNLLSQSKNWQVSERTRAISSSESTCNFLSKCNYHDKRSLNQNDGSKIDKKTYSYMLPQVSPNVNTPVGDILRIGNVEAKLEMHKTGVKFLGNITRQTYDIDIANLNAHINTEHEDMKNDRHRSGDYHANESAYGVKKYGNKLMVDNETRSQLPTAVPKSLNALSDNESSPHAAVESCSVGVGSSLTIEESSKTLTDAGTKLESKDMNNNEIEKEIFDEVLEKIKVKDYESDEDHEYVQSQLFIGNLAVNTSQKEIRTLLKDYNIQQVWIAFHKNKMADICAFVKVSSFKETRRLITEKKEAFLRGHCLKLRFASSRNFEDYVIAKPTGKITKSFSPSSVHSDHIVRQDKQQVTADVKKDIPLTIVNNIFNMEQNLARNNEMEANCQVLLNNTTMIHETPKKKVHFHSEIQKEEINKDSTDLQQASLHVSEANENNGKISKASSRQSDQSQDKYNTNRPLHKQAIQKLPNRQDIKTVYRKKIIKQDETSKRGQEEHKSSNKHGSISLYGQEVKSVHKLGAQKTFRKLEEQKQLLPQGKKPRYIQEQKCLHKQAPTQSYKQKQMPEYKGNQNTAVKGNVKPQDIVGKHQKVAVKLEQKSVVKQAEEKPPPKQQGHIPLWEQMRYHTVKKEPTSAAQEKWKPDLDNINIYKLLKLECSNKPVIGLQYIQETVRKGFEDAITYQCKLCSQNFTTATVCYHLIGSEHRLKYLEMHYRGLWEEIKHSPEMLEIYCCWIDGTYGREDCIFRKFLVNSTKDGRPVYSSGENVRDLEYTSPWKGMYNLEALRIMSKRRQSCVKVNAVTGVSVKDEAGGNVKDIVAEVSDTNDSQREPLGQTATSSGDDESKINDVIDSAHTEGEVDAKSIWENELKKLEKGVCSKSIVKCQRKSKFLTVYRGESNRIALIGLKEVLELQSADIYAESCYLCFLCKKKLSWQTVFQHVTSSEHRLQYMKCNYPYLYKLVTSNNPASLSIEGFAKEIAMTEGDLRDLEVMIVMQICSVKQDSTVVIKGNVQIEDDSKTDGKSLGNRKRTRNSYGSPKTKRQVLKESECQNEQNINSEEKVQFKKRDIKGLNYNEKKITVKRNLDRGQHTDCLEKVKTLDTKSNSIGEHLDIIYNAEKRNDENVGKRSEYGNIADRDKDNTTGVVANIQTKRKLEGTNARLEPVGKHTIADPRNKRMKRQPLVTADLSYEKCSEKVSLKEQGNEAVKKTTKGDTLSQVLGEWPHTSVIGLSFVCEVKHLVRKELPTLYRCTLCYEIKDKYLVAMEMLHHVCSRIHRENFFKTVRPDLYEEMLTNTINQVSFYALLDQYARLYQDKSCNNIKTEVVVDASLWSKYFTTDNIENWSCWTLVQLTNDCLPVKVCHYVSPSEIHLQLEKTDKVACNELMKNMQLAYKNSKYNCKDQWEEGMFCAAFLMQENLWYRGKIMKILTTKRQGFQVFLIDYGSTHKVSVHNLRRIQQQFQGIACLSFCCTLHNLKPKNGQEEWPLSAIMLVRNTVQGRNLFIEKKAKSQDGKLPVDLLIENEDKDTKEKTYRSLSLFLQHEGLAVRNS